MLHVPVLCVTLLSIARVVTAFQLPQSFRAPAIPLITTDPFTQVWMRGDTTTSTSVTHWDGQAKTTNAIIRIDDTPFQILGSCTPAVPTKPGPVVSQSGRNISPGSCDISNFPKSSEADCNIRCYSTLGCMAFVLNTADNNRCFLKSCAHPIVDDSKSTIANTIDPSKRKCKGSIKTCTQNNVQIYPTRTVFELECGASVQLNLTFLSTMFTDDYVRLSRPVYYVDWSVLSIDNKVHDIDMFLSFSAEHTIQSDSSQKVAWSTTPTGNLRIGNHKQNILGSKGDSVNIDWGYLYLGNSNKDTSLWGGSISKAQSVFIATGNLPLTPDNKMPRTCMNDLPAISAAVSINNIGSTESQHHTFIVAYDDIDSVTYFGDQYKGFWTQTYDSVEDAMQIASQEYDEMLTKSQTHDDALLIKLANAGGNEYAQLCALSYRQTLAATKLVWNHNQTVMWNFLKEISTNGDMSTMDVIFPASPMLLYTNPDLLKLLLVPVLAYANNETYIKFGNPYSPHQLGTYPIADSPTSAQEPMPLENTGNMFYMLLGIVQQQKNDTTWLSKYFPVLRTWADELLVALPYPANQLCTDDFTGRLANNTNLGAKGIVALEAFAELCRLSPKETNCESYSTTAKEYAQVWVDNSLALKPSSHYKMSYNPVKNVPDSWSIKYNLMWQKLLHLQGPFDYNNVVQDELKYYATKSNTFGVPMDPRHTYVKTDWLSWIAAMAGDLNGIDAFHFFFDPIYKSVNATKDRNPFTDLYDTKDADQSMNGAFIARPVIGGLYAHALFQQNELSVKI